jgi:hypothetical protein
MAKLLGGTRIYGNATVDTFLSVGSNIAASNLNVNTVTANNWAGIYTANVLESNNSLYYSNARARSTLSAFDNSINYDKANGTIQANVAYITSTITSSVSGLTTSNIAEGSNLYYTNTRVISAVTGTLLSNLSVSGNIESNTVVTNNFFLKGIDLTQSLITGNVVSGTSTSDILIANAFYTKAITSNTWTGLYTANVIETAGNLYFTNARVYANVAPLLALKANVVDLTTSNVVELNNLYYTNTRVYSNVAPLLVLKANVVDLTTSNVVELNNLYYTNTRVYSNVAPLLALKANVVDLTTANVIETAGNLYFTNTRAINAITNTVLSNISIANNITIGAGSGGTISGANLISAAYIQGNNWIGLYTTNVIEGTNLYYTNARVRSTLSGGTGVVYDTTSGQISIGQNVATTANVTFAALNVTGPVNFYGNVTTHSSNNLSISDNMIYLNSGSESSNPDLGFAGNYNDGIYHHAGFFRDHNDGRFKVFDNYAPEPDANIFIQTSHATFRLANLAATTFYGNVQGQVSTISNFTTDNLAEGSNLYYTNTRVVTVLVPYLTTANVNEFGGNLYYTNARVISAVTPYLTTANVNEFGSNLYYTNTRVRSAINAADNSIIYYQANGNIQANVSYITSTVSTTIFGLTTSNIAEGTNLYYTNARVYSGIVNTTLSNLTVSGNITAGNLITGGGVGGPGGSITGANLISASIIQASTIITGANASISGSITGANLISGNYIQGNIWQGLYTANVIETSGNLYFTNARVRSAVGAADNSIIYYSANGNFQANVAYLGAALNVSSTGSANIANFANTAGFANTASFANIAGNANVVLSLSNFTTSNLAEGSNLYFTNARVYSNISPLLVLKANVVDLTTSNVIELNNLYFTNARAIAAIVNTSLSNLTVTGNITAGNILTGSGSGGTISGGNLISANYIQGNIWQGLYTANVIETAGNLYFTNARVYANIAPLLTTANVAEIASNLYFTNARVYANISPLLGAKANVVDLTTSNVIELNNLYYTNTRVYSNVFPLLAVKANVADLTTANTVELNNLYFTNARVVSAVVNSQLSNITLTGNLVAGNIITGSGGPVGGSITGANLISANYIQGNSWIGLYSSNVIELNNLFYTNTRVRSNVIALLPTLAGTGISIDASGIISATTNVSALLANLTTANISEAASNLYFTNARVYANIAPLLTTANVNEFGSNLYFTNTRVYSNIVSALSSFTTANINEGSNLYYTNSRVLSYVTTNITTSNITEGINLYYTNARVASYLSTANIDASFGNLTVVGNLYIKGDINEVNSTILNVDDKNIIVAKGTPSALLADGAGLLIDGAQANLTYSYSGDKFVVTKGLDVLNGTLNSTNLVSTFATVNGNAIITGNLVTSNIRTNSLIVNGVELVTGAGNITVSTITANVWQGLYTANVIETAGNLYFTNARVYANIAPLLTTANITESSSNLYFTNTRVISAVVNSTLANITVSGNVNSSNLNTNVMYANTFISTGVGIPTIDSITNINLNANGSIGGAVVIGSSPLRFRSYTTVDTGNLTPSTGDTIYNTTTSGLQVWNGAAWVATGATSTSNIAEGSNLYYTNARVLSFVSANITTSNIAEGSNLYYTNTRVYSNIVSSLTSFTTANINEGSNLYYTNARVVSAVTNAQLSNLSVTGNIFAGNITIANTITLQNINVTSNILNGGGSVNTAYLNSSNIITGNIQANAWYGLIKLAGNGLVVSTNTTSGVQTLTVDTANLQILAAGSPAVVAYDTFNGGNKNYTLSRIITGNNANIIMVSINGLEQIPNLDYTLTGTQALSFTANTSLNSTIAVKYLGYSAYVTPNAMVLASSTVIPTVQGQSSYMMGANVSAPEKILVMLDGLTQRPTADYTVNNTTLTFTSAPPEGSNIEIRFMGQEALALNGAANTTSYISNSITLNGGGNTFNLGSNVSFARNIIVNVDGLAQIPVTDYNVYGGNSLVFTSNVSANSVVEVKFFGAEALGTINFNNTIVAASLTGGNGVKISANGIITLDILSPFLLMGA